MSADEKSTDGTPSAIITAAREAGNTWMFNGKEIQKYVARGENQVATSILNKKTGEETGALMIHKFKWSKETAFVERESSFKTSLRRIGRATAQDVDTAHLITVNSEFYIKIVSGGELRIPEGNGEFRVEDISQEDMIKHAHLYPESASEAIETWLESPTFELYTEEENTFRFLFEAPDKTQVLWLLGNRDNPVAAAIFTFKSPTSEKRKEYDQAVQKIKTDRQGEVSKTILEQNFMKKIQHGIDHLVAIDGIAIGSEGNDFTIDKSDKKTKGQIEDFVILFGPTWFAEVVDVMHDSFDFMKGKSGKS